MKQKPQKNRAATLVIVFVCVALVFAAIWGIVTVIAKVMHYGEHATIQEEPVVSEKEPDVETAPEVNPEDILDKNIYSADGFYEKNGLRYYHGGDYIGVPGIDVSQYQPEIDWTQVKEAGVEFAFIRVGYRGYVSGLIEQDRVFTSHIEGALDAGLDVGVYFFSQALTPEEAREEAEYVLEQIEDYNISYPIVFDWEEIQNEARTDEMNMAMLTTCALEFCKTIEEAGYEAAVYFNQVFGYLQLNLVSLKDYDFWLAEYNTIPSFAYDFQYWQYTSEGEVPGIEGPVDMNIAFQKKQ